jgi:hypothetical protein
MCHKPNRAEGQAKLQRWADERNQRHQPDHGHQAENIHPRGNQDPNAHDLERSVERFEALLGR